jgi:small conductance mechanosensitive channel
MDAGIIIMKACGVRILALFFLVMCQVNFIQAPASSDYEIMPTPEAPPASRKLDKSQRDALKTLIKNLESKQERQLLINDLRTLVKAEDQLAQDRPSSGLGLSTISNGLHSMTSKIIEFFDEVQHALERLSKYMKNEELRSSILTTGYWILGIIITAIGIDSGLKSLHMPLRHLFVMNARKEHLSHKRLIINVGIFESLIIVCLFVIMLTGLSFVDSASTPGLILELTIVNLVFYLVVLHVLRTLFYYKQKLVTVFYLNKDTGKLIYRFLRFVTAITILGMSMGETVTMIDGSPVFYAAIIKTMLLTQCIVASIFVVRVKDRVRLWLLSENEDKEETGLSSKAAKTWHVWVLVYLFVFGLTIYFQTINNMKEVVVSFGATAFLVAIAYLLVLKMPVMSYGMMDKVVTSFPHMASRHRFYGIFTSLIFGVFIIITALYGAFKIWDLETVDFLFSDGVKPVFTTLLNIFFIAVIGVVVWEANEYLIQQTFKNEVMAHKNRARRQRLATMMPLIQIIARGFILGIFVIMAFSELKLDVTPLLAGLGVIGIAFSFGSQSLVKDFITGIFILIEDTMNVGDIVQIDTQKGTVETLSLRTVKLRDTAGDLHTIPFSTINRVTNMTKNFSYYVVELLLPFEQDMEPVIEAIKEVGQQIHEDAGFKNYILGDVEIMGLDRFADYGVVMMARIKTVPDKHRWVVGREFNLRIQKLFNERNIEFSTTTQKIFLTSESEKKAS